MKSWCCAAPFPTLSEAAQPYFDLDAIFDVGCGRSLLTRMVFDFATGDVLDWYSHTQIARDRMDKEMGAHAVPFTVCESELVDASSEVVDFVADANRIGSAPLSAACSKGKNLRLDVITALLHHEGTNRGKASPSTPCRGAW